MKLIVMIHGKQLKVSKVSFTLYTLIYSDIDFFIDTVFSLMLRLPYRYWCFGFSQRVLAIYFDWSVKLLNSFTSA